MKELFRCWEGLKRDLSGRYLALFLDYDGTLAAIAETPARAVIPQATRALLRRLAGSPKHRLTVISGRALGDIKKRVGLADIVYAGNHGLEVAGPKIKFKPPLSPRYRAALGEIKRDLTKKTSAIPGALVENKGLSLTLHYRRVERRFIAQLKAAFQEVVMPYLIKNEIKTRAGKKALEVRPAVGWDKGKVVLWLLAREKFIPKDRAALPIYIGDDTTDEDAFRALKGKGLTIFVGRPKGSCAEYYLRNPQEVVRFLRRILKIERQNICRN